MLHYGRPTAIVTTRLSTKSLGARRPPPDSVRKGTVVQWRSGPAGDPPAVDQPQRASHHQAIQTGRLSTAA